MELLIIILLLGSAASSPISTRCFHGGQLIAESKSATSISEFCLKDDVSMIKSEVTYIKNDTGIYGHNKVFRSWTIKDWKLCNPIPTAGGSINVIEVNSDLSLATRAYVCSRDCTITIDKEDAQIIFQTDKLNHFEVSGTTLSSGWFKTKASVTLDRTCEHIKVTCGKKSLQFHACFKHHMSCIRFFHHTILPGTMVSSMCQNIELIIIIGLTLVIFILMVILTKTYICYLLMPVFMPVAYIYGWAYNKSCKKCNCCGLAYHPFTNCGSHCVCGLKFEASDRMRLHRESGLCQGYKSLRIARMLCKSKGSSLVISGLLSMLLLSFITPIEGTLTNYHSRKSKYISTVSLESLDEFRRAMSDKLSHTLMIYNFKPTANLPHIKPTYKFITANGIENSDGIDSAYILSSIPALGGMSVGYNIQTKDNFPLLDIIVFIKSAIIKTTYNHIYDTGPTIGINTQHDEHCTGPCPTLILHKENWLTFSQERTSRWGCEEFGCLAINTGCVFGSCQDIIHPEAKVYRKAIEEEVVLTVCITFPGNTYCTEINAIEPKITDEIELQFKTVDTKTLPNLLMVQNHKLYSGQIDDLGSFSQGCGNVQKTNQSVIGAGTAKFDYVCHGASRKDVIVRRCYNNNYESCKLLKEETSLIFADNHETLEVANTKHLIGELQFKIMLGDIRYKSFAESPELEVDAKCVGCPSCFESYSCNFQIVTNIDTVCSVDGPCTLFHNRLIISATKQSYGFKMSCPRKPEPTEEFQICNRKYNVLFTTIDKNDKIEINTGDQTSYIYEKDNRCKTWLCRVRDEGISVIFEPLKAFFGSYFSIIFYVVVGIIVLFLTIYIFLPMFFKLRDILKRNEYLYLQELKHK
uniref:Envelopment polyprotein n=1 Tax=Maguari virus TaxID=11575 RepID=Q6WGL4_MAGV|nr:glycoprotein precursor [Maguari virus]